MITLNDVVEKLTKEVPCISVKVEKEGGVAVGLLVKVTDTHSFSINLREDIVFVDGVECILEDSINWKFVKEEISSVTKMQSVSEYLSKWENVNSTVCCRFATQKRITDESYMANIVSVDILDMKLTFYVEDLFQGTYMAVSKKLLTQWGITVHELLVTAFRNTVRLHAPFLATLGTPISDVYEERYMAYVLTSDDEFGAVHMLNTDSLQALSNDISAKSIAILPVSVHHAFLIPDADEEFVASIFPALLATVEIPNKNDYLPYHFYVYGVEQNAIHGELADFSWEVFEDVI